MPEISTPAKARLLLLAAMRVRARRVLGDVEGHEFHGNQYTGGGSYPKDLTKIGPAKGSNPGGLHVDGSGQKWYVKQYGKPEQAASEHVANQIYAAVGAKVPESALGPKGELATKWLPDAGKTLGQTGLTKENSNAILDHYAADVFTANWDAVGTGHDNVLVGKNGDVTRVDQGGTLLYRAQGGLKPEGALGKIGEWNTLADPGMNHYYAQVFKAAGVKGPDALGSRAVKQIDAIRAARPTAGWKSFVEKAAPHAGAAFHEKVGAMLESRQKGLEEKRASLTLKGLEWNPELHPRGPDGKFGDGTGEKGKKAPKAPPVPMHIKDKAYQMVKGGKSFKATATELGMTQGQVAGHVWKVDQKQKAIEESLKAQPAAAPPPVAAPPSPSSPTQSLTTQEKKEAAYNLIKSGKATYQEAANIHGLTPGQVAGHVWKTDQKAKAEAAKSGVPVVKPAMTVEQFAKTSSPAVLAPTAVTNSSGEQVVTSSTGHIVVSKDGKTATYHWTEKTKENSPHAKENLGKYAYFKDGVQVSGAYPKDEHAEAAGSINQGKGPSVGATVSVSAPYQHVKDDFAAHVEKGTAPAAGHWPISNDVNRTEGMNTPKVLQQSGEKWAAGLTAKETSSIKGYTGSSYHGVNAALRNGAPVTASPSANAIHKAIEKAPSPPPPDLVWRGVSHSGAAALVKGLNVDDVITLPGFQSTSINPHFAKNWSSGGTVFEIKPAAGAYVKVISSHSHEHEYLLPHNAKYAMRGISHVTIDGKKTAVVKLEMLHGH